MTKVSFIMTAHNAEKYIAEAIESVLSQTNGSFELIIVDDGSTDNTAKIVETYHDERIKFIRNDQNMRSVFSRNRAIKESAGKYLAILDSDDVTLPRRVEIESRFLDDHDDVGVVGSAVEVIDQDGKATGTIWKNKLPSEMIPGILLFQNYLANSSTMFRREVLTDEKEAYRQMEPSDDYDLWSRIDKSKWKIINLPKVLVKYRIHGSNMNTVYLQKKEQMVEQIKREALAKLDLDPSDEEFLIHKTNYKYQGTDVINFLNQREKWLLKIQHQNNVTKVYEPKAFAKVLTERWLASCSANSGIGFASWNKFWSSPFSKNIPYFLWPAICRFVVKCILIKA